MYHVTYYEGLILVEVGLLGWFFFLGGGGCCCLLFVCMYTRYFIK